MVSGMGKLEGWKKIRENPVLDFDLPS